MKDNLKLHFVGIKTALMVRMAYRVDYIISIVVMLIVELFAPFITFLIYFNGGSFPGWNMYEVLLIQGIFLLSRGISFPLFFGMVWNTLDQVRLGTFDLWLIKPRPVIQTAIVTGFDSEDIGKLLGGIMLSGLALHYLPRPGIFEWIQFIIIILMSMIVMLGFAVFMAGTGIIWIGNYRIYEIFFSISNFGMYPNSIFPIVIKVTVSVVLPISMLGAVPAAVLLGKVSGDTIIVLVSSILFFLASLLYWNLVIRKYTSAGG